MESPTSDSPFWNSSSLTLLALSPNVHCSKLTEDFDFVFVLVPTIYVIIFVIGTIGNSIIIVGLTCCVQKKTVANIYIVNLAIADLSFVATLPLWAVNMLEKYKWIFGAFMCKLCAVIMSLNMYASIFLLTCLSIDRYFGIVHPMKSLNQRTRTKAKIATAIVWCMAGAVSLPTMYFRQTYYSNTHQHTVCSMKYPKNSIFWMTFVELTKTIVGFVIPFIFQGICYGLIYKNILTSPKKKLRKQKSDKVLKIVVTMACAFIICWLPFQTANFLKVLAKLKIITSCKIIRLIHATIPITVCIAFSNSCVNPILYYFASKRFRNQLTKSLRRSLYRSYENATQRQKSGRMETHGSVYFMDELMKK
ncbi:type-1 angiotensin II receptor-like [Spea bombifrons]|uniref:type-1 angiotensin II receptor-like n=1 Tax=Spea bombifrons TaxID=233779 RepID=UPI00234AE526|nr:type-1 angiotensin II receptor-like [Spea bombifrons]